MATAAEKWAAARKAAERKKLLESGGKAILKGGAKFVGKKALGALAEKSKWLANFGDTLSSYMSMPADQLLGFASEGSELIGGAMGFPGASEAIEGGAELAVQGAAQGASSAASVSIGKAIPTAIWLAGMLAQKGGSDQTAFRNGMLGISAAVSTVNPYAGLAIAALSFIAPNLGGEPSTPELNLSGNEVLKFTEEEGLVGLEGFAWPWNPSPAVGVRGEEFLNQMGVGRTPGREVAGQVESDYDPYDAYKEFETNPDRYYQQKGWTKTPSGWIDQDAVYVQNENLGFDWGLTQPEIGPYGRGINPKRFAQVGQTGTPGEAAKDLTDPVVSPKYGDLYNQYDLEGQGALRFYLYGGSSPDVHPIESQSSFDNLRGAMNKILGGAKDIFNSNIMDYVDTLAPDAKVAMLNKLKNTEFKIDFDAKGA